MTKWARIIKNHTTTNKRAASGKPMSESDFVASDEPVPVTTAQLEQLVAAGAAEEVPAPAGKGTDKVGRSVDREQAAPPAADAEKK